MLGRFSPDVMLAIDVARFDPGRFAVWALLAPMVTRCGTSTDNAEPLAPLHASSDLQFCIYLHGKII